MAISTFPAQHNAWLEQALRQAEHEHLLRTTDVQDGVGGLIRTKSGNVLSFNSNDYLNFSARPNYPNGVPSELLAACSSRLVGGTLAVHAALEEQLSQYLRQEATLVFSSGYLANVGILSSVARRSSVVISDRLVHASLIDGIRLSQARHLRFRHNDTEHLEFLLQRAKSECRADEQIFVVTESVFSMDGDLAPLEDIVTLTERFGAYLIVDEAHALGVFGPGGAGRVVELGLCERVFAVTATLSKAIASYGGLVSGSELLRKFLVQKARSFIYNTALPPVIAEAALCRIQYCLDEPRLGPELQRRAAYFREGLRRLGGDVFASESHIVPLRMESAEEAIRVSNALRERGMYVRAIRTPTVPPGTDRLRFSITLAHQYADLAFTVETLGEIHNTDGVSWAIG